MENKKSWSSHVGKTARLEKSYSIYRYRSKRVNILTKKRWKRN